MNCTSKHAVSSPGEKFNLLSEICERGYAFVPSYRVNDVTVDAFATLGEVTVLDGFCPTQMLVPRSAETVHPNTYSGNFGRGEFPLHTDLAHWAVPPRYIGLRCVKGDRRVATRLLDGLDVLRHVGRATLRRALAKPRRPLRGNTQLLHLLDVAGQDEILRWDGLFLLPASSTGEAVFLQMKSLLEKEEPHSLILGNLGDTLLIDNWRMLHGRSPVPIVGSDRRIDRVYLANIF